MSTRTKIISAATVLAVGLGAGLLGFAGLGGTSSEFQTVSSTGANPFMSPVGIDQPGMTPVAGAGGEQAGDTSGLYAQDPQAPACDVNQLATNLEADPAKAAAWAAVLEIAPETIRQFTAGLTPVVLRVDTAVIDHGYQNGAYLSTPAVLATGTAVFINAYGEPTVKCYSGNPLTRGESSEAGTVITPASAVIATNTFVHTTTGRPVVVPGKPDTTGSGPNPNPGPGTGPLTPTTPPLTGTFNHDGTVTLSDGRIMNPDGSFKTTRKVDHPAGSRTLPDGGIRHPDGTIFNVDGTERKPIRVVNVLGNDVIYKPDGTVVYSDGTPYQLPPGVVIRHNYDGTITWTQQGPDGGVRVIGLDGKRGPLVAGTVNPDGSVTSKDGKVLNPDGSERKKTRLPDGGTIEPNGPVKRPPLAGTFNHDGTVTLSDGRIMNPDGSFKEIQKVNHPAGSTTLPDGGIRHPDGTIFNKDGTERKPITLANGMVLNPDGTILNRNGTPFRLPAGAVIRHNYDGTITWVHQGPDGGVVVIGLNGNPGPPIRGTINPDGSVTTTDGKVLNPDGSERKQTKLPDGGTIEPDGTTVPPAPKAGTGKKPEQNPQPGLAGGEAGQAGRPDGESTPDGEGGPDSESKPDSTSTPDGDSTPDSHSTPDSKSQPSSKAQPGGEGQSSSKAQPDGEGRPGQGHSPLSESGGE